MKGKSKVFLLILLGLIITCCFLVGVWILIDIVTPTDHHIDARLKQDFSYEIHDVMWLDPKSSTELTTVDEDAVLVFDLSITNHADKLIRMKPRSWDLYDDEGVTSEAILTYDIDSALGEVFLDVQPGSSTEVLLAFYIDRLAFPLSVSYEGDMIFQIPSPDSEPVIYESGK